jgi:AcrR family transcriptional regulator
MKTQKDSLTTKEKIIRVAMDIIAQEGFQNITVRKIATQAGVNVAAINYHFGSKDAVISEALKTVTDELKSTFEYLKASNERAETKLAAFINSYTNIMLNYPDIIKNMIYHAINNKPLDGHAEYLKFLKIEGIELIKQTIGQIRPDQEDYILYLKTLNLVSGLSFPFLMGEQTKEVMGIDFHNREIGQMHTKILLENICRKE